LRKFVLLEKAIPAGPSDAALRDLQNYNNQTLFHGPPDVKMLPYQVLVSEKEEEVQALRKQGDLPFVQRYLRIKSPKPRPKWPS
jgi:hypothetical protein